MMNSTITLTVELSDLVGLNRAVDIFQNAADNVNLYADTVNKPDDDLSPPGTPKSSKVTPIHSKPKAPLHKPIAETSTPPVNVELDKEGLPWDGRIHGTKKSKTAKGLWKKIKNLEKNHPGLLAEVEAELKAAMIATPNTPITTTTPAPPTTTKTPAPPEAIVMYLVDGDDFTAEQLQAAGWTDAAIADLPIAETSTTSSPEIEITFPEFMAKYTPAIAAGTLTQEMVSAALNRQGLQSIPLLASRPDLLPAVNAELFPNG